jgi:glycosyltransferase involved in cell wall biosynthesis
MTGQKKTEGAEMKISVIVCTYNRSQSLVRALDSVAAQKLPASLKWEVLVVDNNSCDQTREVVEDFCRRHPGRFRYLFERQQGKSHALNAGVCEAKGEILAFLDDDVTIEPTWLDNLTLPLRNGEWAGTGGRVIPAPTPILPDWLARDGPYSMLGIVCAHFDLGDKPLDLDLYHAPYGANMAFQKSMFERYGGFRIDLGPSPGSEIRNEDTEFGRRLMAAGECLRYEPSAIVYHPAPEQRLQKDFFLRWWFDFGRAFVREWGRGPAVMGIPRPYLNILKLGTTVMAERLGRWMLSFNPQKRFYNKCWVWMTTGQIREYYRLARTSKAKKDDLVSERSAT